MKRFITKFIVTNKLKSKRLSQWLWFGGLYVLSICILGGFIGLLHGILYVTTSV